MTTKTIPTPQEILTRAADLIDERGWCQHFLSGEAGDGTLSIVGAMRLATAHAVGITGVHAAELVEDAWPVEGRDELARVWEQATHAVGDRVGGCHIGVWNDMEGRAEREVVAVLRAAAEGGAQ